MNISAEALRELHRIHRQLSDLRDQLVRGPRQVAAAESHVRQCEARLAEAKESHTKARVFADGKQLQLKGREDRILDLKAKLNAANSNKEYQALKEQIAADEEANSVLSDEILESLEKIDDLQAGVATASAELAQAQVDLQKTRGRINDRQATLEAELARVSEELARAELKLTGEFKSEYQRIVKARGEDALAPLEGGTCGGCFTTVSPQTMNELLLEKPVFCKSCGCLLYLPEERSAGGG